MSSHALLRIAGLHALQRGRYGRLGAIGSLTAFISFALMLVEAVARTLARGRLLVGFVAIGSLDFLAALIGLMPLGYMSQRAETLPRWCGVLLSIGFPLWLALRVVLWWTLGIGWVSLAQVLLGIIWALVGYALLSYSEARDGPINT